MMDGNNSENLTNFVVGQEEFFGSDTVLRTGEVTHIDPEEKVLTISEVPKEKKPDPSLVDLYAFNYHMYIQPFCNYIDRLSLKSLRRIMKAIAKYPLEIEEFVPHGDAKRREEEKHVFGLGHQVFFAKYMMIALSQLDQEMKKLENANKASVAETTDLTNKEGE